MTWCNERVREFAPLTLTRSSEAGCFAMSYQDDRFRGYFPDELGLQISDVAITTQTVVIGIQSIQTRACCPGCDQPSERIHSHDRRQVSDHPWQGRHVVLRITLRRFRCANPACQQKVF